MRRSNSKDNNTFMETRHLGHRLSDLSLERIQKTLEESEDEGTKGEQPLLHRKTRKKGKPEGS